LAFDVGGRWSLTPGLRYRSISRDLDIGSVTTTVDLQYIALEFGVALRF
jgi:hypothetical protein